MDKWLTVPPDLEPFIGSVLALYSLYRPKKMLLGRGWAKPYVSSENAHRKKEKEKEKERMHIEGLHSIN
jgi:hypothetical protein